MDRADGAAVVDRSAATAAALLDLARDLVPALRERSARAEELRRIPSETVREFLDASFHLIAVPARFGGLGLDLDTVIEVGMELGRGCGSTAWMSTQWPGHGFMVGMFSDQAQVEYWADGTDVLSSTASAGACTAEPVDGGVALSGRMRFSSGVDAASWLLASTTAGLCLVPVADVEIIDDWFVAGLRGTGSKSVVFDGAFVPEHRIVPSAKFHAGGGTYGADHYDSAFYRVRYALWAPGLLAGAIVGMARGLVDIFDERVRGRADGHSGQPAIERPGNQLRFAEATAEVDTAALLVRTTFASMKDAGAAGEELTLAARARIRRDLAYSVKLCEQAAQRLSQAGDASALYETHHLHRFARDIHAGALHISTTWDEPAVTYSRVRWGLEPQTRLI